MSIVVKRAYAKINLGLQVIKKRDDGYHDLRMIMDTIDLFDELIFSENKEIEVTSEPYVCKMEDNLVYKAVLFMKKKYNIDKGIKIHIIKHIPLEAGLAGGSSDAACTIRTLNDLWGINATNEELKKLSEDIGSDVPYCLLGGLALVERRGELITPIDQKLDFSYILIKPKYNCKTKDIFNNFHIINNNERFEKLYSAIQNNDLINIPNFIFNDLEKRVNDIVENNKPKELIKALINLGCNGACMTGSGSTIFGLCLNDDKLYKIYQTIKKKKIYQSLEFVEISKTY